jgi:hypothetical protein
MKRAFLLVVFSAVALVVQAQQAAWKIIQREHGVTVDTKDQPGRDLPTLRGRGIIRGDISHVLAIIMDAEHATEWAEGADECKLLKTINPREHLIYTRTDTPWPVSDRDIVMRRTVEVLKPGQEFRVRMICAPKEKAALDDVVRIVDCDSHFYLRRESDTTTFMEYQVNLDPGGSLPDFLIKWASKKVPMNTFLSLEKQVEKRASSYDAQAKHWAQAN